MSEQGDVLDLTKQGCEASEEESMSMRLKSGLSLADVTSRQGALIQPILDPVDAREAEKELKDTYYSKYDNYTSNRFSANCGIDITAEFSELKRQMEPLTEDLGVYKLKMSGARDCGVGTDLPERATVTIHYEFMIEGQDEPFDSTFIRGVPEMLKLNELLFGMEVLVKSMKVGDTVLGILSPDYAFGAMGVPPRIPGDSELLVVVKLISFIPEGEGEKLLEMDVFERRAVPLSQIMKSAESEHIIGNNFVKDEDWKAALRHYGIVEKLLKERKDEKTSSWKALLEKIYLNKALCHLKLDRPQKALDDCKNALDLNEKSAKAHFRAGKAYISLDMYPEAKDELREAHKISPKDPGILKEIVSLDTLISERKEAELALCKKIFKDVKNIDKKTDDKVKESVLYQALKDFADEEGDELVLQCNPQTLDTLRQSAKLLDLGCRVTTISASQTGQRVVITKKKN